MIKAALFALWCGLAVAACASGFKDATNTTKDYLDCRGEISRKIQTLKGSGCTFAAAAVRATVTDYGACKRANVPTPVLPCDAGAPLPALLDGGAGEGSSE